MLKKKTLQLVRMHLQRIFAFSVTRSTFREIQNVALAASEGDTDVANKILEAFFTGQIKEDLVSEKTRDLLEQILDEYSMLVRLSKEVQDRGDVVSLIVSDPIEQKDAIGFIHRLKKVDGTEFSFVTDPNSTVSLLHHFISRIEEMDQSKLAAEELRSFNEHFAHMRDFLDEIVKKYPALPEKA